MALSTPTTDSQTTRLPAIVQASHDGGRYYPITGAKHPQFPCDYPIAAWHDVWSQINELTEHQSETEKDSYARIVNQVIATPLGGKGVEYK